MQMFPNVTIKLKSSYVNHLIDKVESKSVDVVAEPINATSGNDKGEEPLLMTKVDRVFVPNQLLDVRENVLHEQEVDFGGRNVVVTQELCQVGFE